MDKVELSVADIEALLAWRDQHQNEVRSHPAPLKAVEMSCRTTGTASRASVMASGSASIFASGTPSSGTVSSSGGRTGCGRQ